MGTQTPVTVTDGVTTTGVDAALVRGGAVSGIVTDAGGSQHGLGRVLVEVSSMSTGDSGTGLTAPDGSYSVKDLVPGTDYRVCFDGLRANGGASDATGYVNECYNDQPLGSATLLTLTGGVIRSGTNAVLAGRP